MPLKHHQTGFAALEAILILLVVGIIGGTGWFVWHSKQVADKNLKSADTSSLAITKAKTTRPITDFASCKAAAGSQENSGYPDYCYTKDNRAFVKLVNATVPVGKTSADTASWTLFAANTNAFSVRIPDGWNILHNTFGDDIYSSGALVDKPGTAATITATDKEDIGIFEAAFSDEGDTQANAHNYVPGTVQFGSNTQTEVGEIVTNSGLKGTEYLLSYPNTQSDGFPAAGTKAYAYHFVKGGVSVNITYFMLPGTSDETAMVQKAVQTLGF